MSQVVPIVPIAVNSNRSANWSGLATICNASILGAVIWGAVSTLVWKK